MSKGRIKKKLIATLMLRTIVVAIMKNNNSISLLAIKIMSKSKKIMKQIKWKSHKNQFISRKKNQALTPIISKSTSHKILLLLKELTSHKNKTKITIRTLQTTQTNSISTT
jgi:predicted Zn-dependent protease